MKHSIALLFLCAASAYAQTAAFPGSVATNENLKVQVNGIQTTLLSSITPTSTTAQVSACAGIVANTLATIDQEITAITSCTGNTMTFDNSSPGCTSGRACDGTTAAAHTFGAAVSLFVDAWHHNALRVEIEAIENALGANLVNVGLTPPATIAGNTSLATLTVNNTGPGIGIHVIGGGLSVDTGASTYIFLGASSGYTGDAALIAPLVTMTTTNSAGGTSNSTGADLHATSASTQPTIYVNNTGSGLGIYGSGTIGISGHSTGTGYPFGGIVGTGTAAIGVLGQDTSTGYGGYFTSSTGVAVYGSTGGATAATFVGSGGTCSIVPTTTSLSCSSDARLKEDDITISDGLSKIMSLRPLTFVWRKDTQSGRHGGFYAQELRSVLPALVSEGPDGYLMANYTGVIPYLVSAIQEMQSEIEHLQSVTHNSGLVVIQ